MAQITVGGVTYTIPEMNFLSIERAWPFVQQATNSLDPMQGISAALAVIAAGLMETEDFDHQKFGMPEKLSEQGTHTGVTYFLKKRLRGTELGLVQAAMFEILREAGLEVTEGEAVAVLAAAQGTAPEALNPSPETVLDTSPSLSPQGVKEEAGTS